MNNKTSLLKEPPREAETFAKEKNARARPKPASRAYLFFKRFLDIVLSAVGLVVLIPVFLVIAIVIKSDSKGKVIYRHNRLGKDGRIIKIYKFRTMIENADEAYHEFTPEQKAEFEKHFKLENDPRITRAGKFLRTSSLDELPQLLNILKGELSIVGPRPVVEPELAKFGENAKTLLSVRPGLTGNWQVNGRNDITYADRINMDMYYIENQSFWLDLKIIIKTFAVVVKKNGAY